MSRSPRFVWKRRLHEGLKQQVIAELTAAFFRRSFMNAAETIQPTHLRRLAVVYVRQSTPHQPLMNQESLKLQYALQDHARDAGWDPPQVRVIDTDLGCKLPAPARDAPASRNSSPSSPWSGSASSSPMTSRAWPVTAPTGINSSTPVATASARRRPGRHLRPGDSQWPPDPRPQGLDL